jgi:hypothetical protein
LVKKSERHRAVELHLLPVGKCVWSGVFQIGIAMLIARSLVGVLA